MKAILIKPFFEYPQKSLPDIEFYKTVEECEDAEIMIGYLSNVSKEVLDRMPNLKWIQLLSAGYDSIDVEYLKERNIMLTNGRGIYSVPIAEDVVCKILMSNCNAVEYINNQRNRVWKVNKTRKELCGQTVGIIGTGSIASEIAKRLSPFGVKIVGYKRKKVESMPHFDEIYCGEENLNHVISMSDYIVVTVDLNDKTKYMLNKDNLKYMKEDATIINIARGSIINQQDLVELIKERKIKFAGLDVFETEPVPQDDEIWSLDNLYMTPHSSGTVLNNKDKVNKLIVENLIRYRDGEKLMNLIEF